MSVSGSTDPTGTVGLREREFRPALTNRFRALRAATRTTVGYEKDALRLKRGARDGPFSVQAAADDIDPAERFVFQDDAELTDTFLGWLDEQIDRVVLEPVSREQLRQGGHWSAPYIRSAAEKGWADAAARLERQGLDVSSEDLSATFDRGVSAEQLRGLYTRTYDNIETITDRMRTEVRRELTQGLAEGLNPRVMADRLTDRVDVAYTDAETLARTEIIHSYNDHALTRYETAGVSAVTADVEFLTAGDRRVCPLCASLSGTRYTIAEARGIIPGGTHPQCRCTWVPIVNT